ncbi:RNA-binding protein [Sulfurivermis fontis]|uniref:RNA-binding protein n=1 Tax=Sulfurivermis fontis TaxID=1972068 RepID=UPI000FD7DF13
MKLHFPSASAYGAALILATVLAVSGYVLFPVLALELGGAALFALGIAIGAVLAVPLAGLRLEAGPARAADNGETRSIFVGNLAYRASKDELEQLFGQYGVVRSVRIMTDRMTRRPRGFGFVEMEAKSALAAIKALDGKEFHGRALKVNEGNERRPRESQAA